MNSRENTHPIFIVNCKGGIGNQLFQVFFVIAQHLEYGVNYAVNIEECPAFSHYLFFYANLKSPLSLTIPLLTYNENREPELHALETIGKRESVYFDGYFQDYRYFGKHTEKIKEILHIDWLREKLVARLQHKLDLSLDITRIMVHIRRGDYRNLTCYHPLLGKDYYIESIKHIMKTVEKNGPIHLFIFSQSRERQEDIQEIIGELNNYTKTWVDSIHYVRDYGLTDVEELLLMTWCSHFIIANSTYSWWGAYLSPHCDKIVCCPDVFFGHQLYYINTEGLYLQNWKRIPYRRLCECGEYNL